MRPLRFAGFCLTALIVVLTAGCGNDKNTTAETAFFGLRETVPAVLKSSETVYKRVNPDYTEELTGSEIYGELLPFAGGLNTYNSTAEGSSKTLTAPLYGLCDKSGAIVVDAVYDAVKMHKTDEGTHVYELIKGSDGSDPKKGDRRLAASDGSWVFKIPDNCTFRSVGAERVILERTRIVKKVTYKYLDFYDFNGKRKFTFDSALAEDANVSYTIGAFSEGLAPVNVTVRTPDEKKDGQDQTYTETTTAFYIDNSGKRLYEKLTYCEEFERGYAVAADENGLYGVIDTKGEWFIEPKYRMIDYNSKKGLFACGDKGFYDILNMEKKSTKTILCDRGFIEILDSERLIYKKTNADTGRSEYFYFDTDEPFTCTETGMFPDSENAVGGLYVCTYTGTGTVFDENGDNPVAIGDFGSLVDRFGNTAVAVNSTDRKVCFISVSTKKRTEWMNFRYTRQSAADRYLCLTRSENGVAAYGLYDLLTEAFVFENCDYIEISKSADTELISVVSDGRVTVYDSSLTAVLSTMRPIQH